VANEVKKKYLKMSTKFVRGKKAVWGSYISGPAHISVLASRGLDDHAVS